MGQLMDSDLPTQDPAQVVIDAILQSSKPLYSKLYALRQSETMIETLYVIGLTSVKPIAMMTADDLVS